MTATPDKARFHLILSLLGLASLLVFVASVLAGLWFVRTELRSQIIAGTGELLTRFTQHQYQQQVPLGLAGEDLIDLALDASEMEGVIALRLFEPPDSLAYQIPGNLVGGALTPSDRDQLMTGAPLIRFTAAMPPALLFADAAADSQPFPVVEVLVPVHEYDGQVMAIVQYWLDGSEVRTAFARLDTTLLEIGGFFLLAGTLLYTLLFVAARRRLISLGRDLSERNRALESANKELALLARASAVGSVTGNLFHGLKNPLAGLKSYLRLTQHDAEAVAMADRIQALINETMDALRTQERGAGYTLSLDEIRETAESRFSMLGNEREVQLQFDQSGTAELAGEKVQLLLLILRNLIDNAVAVSQPKQIVSIAFSAEHGQLLVRVTDAGPGIPVEIQQQLFQAQKSSKVGGSGLGLAISAILARQIPARLQLESSSPRGSVFKLIIPDEKPQN